MCCLARLHTIGDDADCASVAPTVGSHNFNPRRFKPGVQDRRTVAGVHFKQTFDSSYLPGAGPIFPD